MNAPIFISYRRADAAAEAGRLYSTILKDFGEDSVFMDTSSIKPGAPWSKEIKGALNAAQIVILIMGLEWLRISDEFGFRRIDKEDDWVRQEIEFSLENNKKVLPLLVKGAKPLPANVLPPSISALTERQAIEIRDTYWDHDVKLVLEQLKIVNGNSLKNNGSLGKVPSGVYPTPHPEIPNPIGDEMLQIALDGSLSKWKKIVSPLPEDSTKVRIELYRQYQFKTFLDAISFMNQVAPGCDIDMNHPRLENVLKSVRIYLSTWDVNHQISDRDIQLAKYFDKAFLDFPGSNLNA